VLVDVSACLLIPRSECRLVEDSHGITLHRLGARNENGSGTLGNGLTIDATILKVLVVMTIDATIIRSDCGGGRRDRGRRWGDNRCYNT